MNYKICSVHGTFAQSDNKSGNLWWQIESPFSKSVLSYLDTENHRISWQPFQWSGKNSVSDRESASKRLSEVLIHDIASNDNIVLLAHSHGGNIVERCRRRVSFRNMLISAITVGTPFFASDNDSNLIRVIHSTWLPACFVLIPSVLSLSLTKEGSIADLFLSLISFSSGLVALLSFFAAFISSTIINPIASAIRSTPNIFREFRAEADKRIKIENTAYPKLYSKNDEAINALRLIQSFKVGLVNPDLATGLSTVVSTAVLFLLFTQDGIGLIDSFSNNYAQRIMAAAGVEGFPDGLTLLLNELPRYGFILLTWVAIAYLISKVYLAEKIAHLLNGAFSSFIRSRALGKDSYSSAYESKKVDANLPLDLSAYDRQHEWRPMPSDFDEDMERINLPATIESFMSIRYSLATSLISGEFALSESFSGNYTGNELLHCTYFDHPDFAGFIAWILCEHYGFPKGSLYATLPQHKFAKWWTSISPAPWSAQVHRNTL